MRRREAEYVVEEGKTGDPQNLELVMLWAWSVSTDPPAGISEAGRPREGVSSPHPGARHVGQLLWQHKEWWAGLRV